MKYLISPNEAYGFRGLKAGNIWCLCVLRWKEAMVVGFPPSIILIKLDTFRYSFPIFSSKIIGNYFLNIFKISYAFYFRILRLILID